MKAFTQQLKWQFILLQKNNIITISLLVTLIYGALLFFLNDLEYSDQLLVSLVLNDPSVIGYFFIALTISTEIKHQILPAIFVAPVNLHHYLLSRVVSLSVIGLVCSLGLALCYKGWTIALLPYTAGCLGICLISAMLGLIMLTFATEFLRFAMLSVPVFLFLVSIPLLDYLGGADFGVLRYFHPIQGSLGLIDHSVSGQVSTAEQVFGYFSVLFWSPFFYFLAFRLFSKKIVHQ